MDIVNIQALIKARKLVTAADIDPANSYVQIGVYQNGNRKAGAGYPNAYAPYAIALSELGTGNTDICKTPLPFKEGSVGPKVSFRKENYANPTVVKDVIIPGVLEITRGNNQGIYNAAIESSYSDPGPANTEWSSPYIDSSYVNFAPLYDLNSRTFDNWRNASHLPNGGYAPALQVGMPMLMRETTTGRLWIIIFTEWSVAEYNPGGGFAYDRWEILSTIEFTKPDYETQTVDKVSDGVWLARENNGALFNSTSEPYYEQRVSPFNTRWNSSYNDGRTGYSGFGDLTNLENRIYSTFVDALDGSVGNNIIGTELIMHDLTTDVYHKIIFNSWTSNNNGGGFSYERTPIPQSCPVKFADGTVLNTAPTGTSGTTCCPTIDVEGNTIIDDTSNNIVLIPVGVDPTSFTHNIPNFSGMFIVNDHYDGRVETWICGGGDGVLLGYTNVGAGPCTSVVTIDGSGYTWANNDGMLGPFTFTVIKTRNGA